MPHPDETPRPRRFGFLLVPRFSLIAFTAAIEPLRLANRVAGRELYAWRLFSADGGPVSASDGVTSPPTAPSPTPRTSTRRSSAQGSTWKALDRRRAG